MNTNQFVVRIVKPSTKPALPEVIKLPSAKDTKKTNAITNICIGSAIGFLAGFVTFIMLKVLGLNFGGMESSLIIGLPSALGLFTSFVIG